jgi:L-threonylcarbamoyladenylate synthase
VKTETETATAQIVRIAPTHPERAFSRCKDAVRSGGVIVYPTDTFYGLGVDPGNTSAVRKLFSIKGRRTDQPILLLVHDQAMLREWVAEITPQAERLMKKFWPGPLTLVFKAKKETLPELTAGTGTIGLRIPGSALTRQLLAYLGIALTGTSANISGGPSITTAEEALETIGDMVDLVLDGGKTAGGKPSTIVDVSADELKVIREGAISVRELSEELKFFSKGRLHEKNICS